MMMDDMSYRWKPRKPTISLAKENDVGLWLSDDGRIEARSQYRFFGIEDPSTKKSRSEESKKK